MPPRRRTRPSFSRVYKTASRVGNVRSVASARLMRGIRKRNAASLALAGVARLNRMIESKEATRRIVNTQCPHNDVNVLSLNPFQLLIGGSDPMVQNSGERIGDKISVRGLMIKGFLENSLGRSKVYWRVMLVKIAKGDILDRATLFQNSSSNKMIDQINTERMTVVAQKTFTMSAPNNTVASGMPGTTVSVVTGLPTQQGASAITGNRIFSMWIPGRKFGRGGNVTFENGNISGQLKFFDYKIAVVCYDWYGTPQDVNNVGFINEMYTKLYFKDA